MQTVLKHSVIHNLNLHPPHVTMMLFYDKIIVLQLSPWAEHSTYWITSIGRREVEEKVTILSYLYHWSPPRAKRLLDLNTVGNVVGDLESHDPYMTDHRELKAVDTIGIGGEIVEGGNRWLSCCTCISLEEEKEEEVRVRKRK